MTDKSKEALALDEVIKSINKMDDTLLDLSNSDETGKDQHSLTKWFESMKALHEIKHTLHKVGKYEKFNENELDEFKEKNMK